MSVYDAAGGHAGMLRLAEAWHRRVLADPVVSHAFSHGYRDDHTPRLAAYLGEALGGPPLYTERYGDESRVVRIHSGNGAHTDMDNRAIRCWDEALRDLGLDGDEPLRRALHDYFAWATRTAMARFHDSADDVPDGLPLRRWSWDGLVPGDEEWSGG
jgi:hemoglobin